MTFSSWARREEETRRLLQCPDCQLLSGAERRRGAPRGASWRCGARRRLFGGSPPPGALRGAAARGAQPTRRFSWPSWCPRSLSSLLAEPCRFVLKAHPGELQPSAGAASQGEARGRYGVLAPVSPAPPRGHPWKGTAPPGARCSGGKEAQVSPLGSSSPGWARPEGQIQQKFVTPGERRRNLDKSQPFFGAGAVPGCTGTGGLAGNPEGRGDACSRPKTARSGRAMGTEMALGDDLLVQPCPQGTGGGHPGRVSSRPGSFPRSGQAWR